MTALVDYRPMLIHVPNDQRLDAYAKTDRTQRCVYTVHDKQSTVPASMKSELVDDIVTMCARDISLVVYIKISYTNTNVTSSCSLFIF